MAVKKHRLFFRNIVFCYVLEVIQFKYKRQPIQTVILKKTFFFSLKTTIINTLSLFLEKLRLDIKCESSARKSSHMKKALCSRKKSTIK